MDSQSKDWLTQTDLRELASAGFVDDGWITVQTNYTLARENGGVWCELVPLARVEDQMATPYRNRLLQYEPGCSIKSRQGAEVVEYHRFGNDEGLEPLVLRRSFHGIREDSDEILEEFRLFHNLFHNVKANDFLKINDDGNEVPIVRTRHGRTQFRLKELRQFLAIKEMAAIVGFDFVRESPIDPSTIAAELDQEYLSKSLCYDFHIRKSEGFSRSKDVVSFSRFVGKVLVAPLSKEKSGIWPYAEREEIAEEFIIGVTADGDPQVHSCDPGVLSNYFGGNPGAPHYLTQVFFKREVLQKYYSNPQKYSVEDNHLRCGHLWGIRLDNNHTRYVIAYLGDLGRDLPASERAYWKTFNVVPDGTLSAVTFKRDFMAEPTMPEKSDLRFKYAYSSVAKLWNEKLGWNLLKPLSTGDLHFLKTLRVPLVEDPSEFDQQILALAKVLVDSLNEKEIVKRAKSVPEGAKGITKLECFLTDSNFPDVKDRLRVLRTIQDVRSSGVAHLKGRNYEKIVNDLGLDQRSYSVVFAEILDQASQLLHELQEHYLS